MNPNPDGARRYARTVATPDDSPTEDPDEDPPAEDPDDGDRVVARRRDATAREAKALGHPLRLRILRLCGQGDLTNRQLADRLERDPGTVLHHVRQLVGAGFLEPAPVRTGASGALEKPYRSTGRSWWLSSPLTPADPALPGLTAFTEELAESGPGSVSAFARFTLHLSDQDVERLDRRLLAVLDEFIATDHERRDQPAHGGIVMLHRLKE